MTTTDTRDSAATIAQVRELMSNGCDIVRVAVPDGAALAGFAVVRRELPQVPLVADIHLSAELALGAVAAGADKIRINPGNIGTPDKLRQVVAACKAAGIPLRIGVNAGSLEQHLTTDTLAEQLVESAVRSVALVEACGYDALCVSAKASNVAVTVAAYRMLAQVTPYPLHIGITEAGSLMAGTIKSAAGLGALLLDGVGDTVRISLAEDPVQEVVVARQLLRYLGLRRVGVEVIACPTCGRTEVALVPLVKEVEAAVAHITAPISIAVMGCMINGKGEAKLADYALIGGKKSYAVMRRGEQVAVCAPEDAVATLLKVVEG